jgi:hypothetical protein
MPRACTKCGRVVAEAAYCPFCSEPTIEYVPVPVHRSEGSEVRTIFTEFADKNRWIAYVVIISLLIAWLGFIAVRFMPCVGSACFVLFGAVFWLTMLYAKSNSLRCPRCEKELGTSSGPEHPLLSFLRRGSCGRDLPQKQRTNGAFEQNIGTVWIRDQENGHSTSTR